VHKILTLMMLVMITAAVSASSGCTGVPSEVGVCEMVSPSGFKEGVGGEAFAGAPEDMDPIKSEFTIDEGKDGAVINSSTSASARLMTYEVSLTLAVADIRAAGDAVIAQVKADGGYMQQQSDNMLILKIPSAKLEPVIVSLEKIGRVVNKRSKADDVTDIMFDMKVRIDNLENLRTHLLALLDKATKVEDMLKIETELARVTKELELLKGRRRLMQNKIAFSTLTLILTSELPQQQVQRIIPISWVKDLGTRITNTECFIGEGSTYCPFNFLLPDGFVLVEYDVDIDDATAVSSEGVVLSMNIMPGLKDAKPEFWRQLIARALTEVNAFKIVRNVDQKVDCELPCFTIEAVKEIGRTSYSYMVTVMVKDEKLYLVECWGESSLFERSKKALEASLLHMQPWKWWQSRY